VELDIIATLDVVVALDIVAREFASANPAGPKPRRSRLRFGKRSAVVGGEEGRGSARAVRTLEPDCLEPAYPLSRVKLGERSKPPSVRPGIRLSVRAVRGEAAGCSGYHGADLHR
jgi:hypothetical protein